MENLVTDDGSFLEATVFLSHFSELPDPRVTGAKPRARGRFRFRDAGRSESMRAWFLPRICSYFHRPSCAIL